MSDFTKKLISVADRNEATRSIINEASAQRLEALCEHMLRVNEQMNLTAITDEDGVILKHFVDSCASVPFIPEGASLVDVGCGGGFPSLPIAILRPDVSILGLDSVTKKVTYVKDTARLLGLDRVDASNARAEVLGRDSAHREKYDCAIARGVGRLNLICELCLPLVKVGGCFIAMKSITASEELDEAQNAIRLLGARVERVFEYTLSNDNEELSRAIIILRKETHTPPKYPRNNSQIAKKRL
ncbi:MAG: 16S rRNA (guanine(527)-N(7))-methyltransferase RsmG [Clostridia bacterium]|nr:16S rRNA (guanine(527)-N(7))-methyltransferase RsmG [Clostridia bacterium]